MLVATRWMPSLALLASLESAQGADHFDRLGNDVVGGAAVTLCRSTPPDRTRRSGVTSLEAQSDLEGDRDRIDGVLRIEA